MAGTKTKPRKKAAKVETQDQLLKLMRALIPTEKWTVNVDCCLETSLRVRGVSRRMTSQFVATMYWYVPQEFAGMVAIVAFGKTLPACWKDFRERFVSEIRKRQRLRELEQARSAPQLETAPAPRPVLCLEYQP